MTTKPLFVLLPLLLALPGAALWANPQQRSELRAALQTQRGTANPSTPGATAPDGAVPAGGHARRLSAQERAELREQLRQGRRGSPAESSVRP